MKWSNNFIPTLKEAPAEAEAISHKLMLRSGLIKKLSSGIYSYLPLGWRVLHKIIQIIREEMDAAGACEVLLPALQPASLWQQSGRYEQMGEVMIKFRDRRDKEMALGPTHEEVITNLVKGHIRSYRQLPIILYQIQTKFRDEPRPRFGIIRSCEFIMKDAYSFDVDEKGLNKNYQKMRAAYIKTFDRIGLDYITSLADPGVMGGDVSEEFMCPAESGEDVVTLCSDCNYAISGKIKDKKCPKCQGRLNARQALEVGHIFQLKTKYTESFKVYILAEDGRQKPIVMGCYGIGVNRIMAAAIEQNYDQHGIIWPKSLSPYQVVILPLNIDQAKARQAAFKIYDDLKKEGIEVLLDDRTERAGVKFKDNDLIGVPLQIIIGQSFLEDNLLEIKKRADQKSEKVKIGALNPALKKLLSD